MTGKKGPLLQKGAGQETTTDERNPIRLSDAGPYTSEPETPADLKLSWESAA